MLQLRKEPAMSAALLRQESPQPMYVVKLNNSAYTLDPYRDRLESQGLKVMDGETYEATLDLAVEYHPVLFVVHDDPGAGIDALRWLQIQHTAPQGWMATTPLIILADESRMPELRREELPDRVLVLQRRADTLNRLGYVTRALLNLWDTV